MHARFVHQNDSRMIGISLPTSGHLIMHEIINVVKITC
jgi:hypothetical protein